MHVQMSLISPFMLALWHMPRMFTKLVPRCLDADPSVSRRHRVSITCVISQAVSSRRASRRFLPPAGLAHIEGAGTARSISHTLFQIPASDRESPDSARSDSRLADRSRDWAMVLVGCPGQFDRRRSCTRLAPCSEQAACLL